MKPCRQNRWSIYLKRLSGPIHGGRIDPKKAKRIAGARMKTMSGEYIHMVPRWKGIPVIFNTLLHKHHIE